MTATGNVDDPGNVADTQRRSWGHHIPVADEIHARELTVTGALPAELEGRYLRNGPNPRPGDGVGHPFTGPGMVHGVRLRGGRAEWYRNRWVRTAAFAGASPRHRDGRRNLAAVSANTHVLPHAGRILALVESGLPYELTPWLDTVGACDFDGRLTTAMTAHPKRHPGSGELHFFGYSSTRPWLTYHRLSATGELTVSRAVEVRGPTMMHDFAITEHHVVWLDLPMTHRRELEGRGVPYRFDHTYGARLGIMRQDDPLARVRWYDIDPCYVFHVGGAHEDNRGRVILTGVRYSPRDITAAWALMDGAPPPSPPPAGRAPGHAALHRWTLDPRSGRVGEQQLHDPGDEFPTLDDDRVGRANRFLYTTSTELTRSGPAAAIAKHDLQTGARTHHGLGHDNVAGEAVFVPATHGSRREDDGWLLTITTRRDGSASQLLVLDASSPDTAPVAAVELPRGVPSGFHGSWIPDTSLDGPDVVP